MTLRYTLRPISDRTAFTGPAESGPLNPFEAGWASTLQVLERELDYLGAERVVFELDVREQDIRVDGTLRANARTEASPAVRIAFATPDGPMQFATDRYGWWWGEPPRPRPQGWQQNVRAIALGLEALRRVDRYGITSRREQYTGFRALPAGQGVAPTGMTTELALEVLREEAELTKFESSMTSLDAIAKRARSRAHPDRHDGDRSRWNAVDEAEQVLRRAGRL